MKSVSKWRPIAWTRTNQKRPNDTLYVVGRDYMDALELHMVNGQRWDSYSKQAAAATAKSLNGAMQ